MFDELEVAIEALVIPGDGDSVIAAIALREGMPRSSGVRNPSANWIGLAEG